MLWLIILLNTDTFDIMFIVELVSQFRSQLFTAKIRRYLSRKLSSNSVDIVIPMLPLKYLEIVLMELLDDIELRLHLQPFILLYMLKC